MKKLMLLSALLAWSGAASAASQGPYSYVSNGYTTTNAPLNYCPSGSNCVIRTGPPLQSDLQITEFRFTTGGSFPGDANQHFAFGVRGNSANANCVTGAMNFPFLGRGIALFPNEKLFFENFSASCYGPGGNVTVSNLESTQIPISLKTRTTYWVTIWADNYDTGYGLWEEYYSGGVRYYAYIADTNCRSVASSAEAASCGRHPNDQFNSRRTFILYTETSQWRIDDWWLHD